MEDTAEDEGEELVVRYNQNGIEMNEEGFQKISAEIAARSHGRQFPDALGQRTRPTLFRRSSARRSFEPIIIRKGFVRQLLPGGKIGAQGTRAYFEVCTDPKLLELARKKVSYNSRDKLNARHRRPYNLSRRRKGSGDSRGLQSH